MRINVIFTYDNGPQDIFDVEVESSICQFDYIDYLFSLLDRNKLKRLVKISNSQYTKIKTAIKWLLIESKYYFNDNDFWSKYKKGLINLSHSYINITLYGKITYENYIIDMTLLLNSNNNNKNICIPRAKSNDEYKEIFSDYIYNLINKFENKKRKLKNKKVLVTDKVIRIIYFKPSNKSNELDWLKDYVDKKIR